MRPLALVPALLVLASCQDATPPQPLTMTGEWRQSGDLRDVATGDGHIHLGTFHLSQVGEAAFEGEGEQSGFCSKPDGSTYNGPLTSGVTFPVLEGQIVGNTVEFRTDLCHFTGAFTDDDRWRMTGVARCAYTYQGTDYEFEGQWQADRPHPGQ